MEFLAKHKKIIALAAVVILAAAGFYFWYRDHHKETGPLVLYGNVDIRQVSVAFNGSERIEEMTKREGDRVKKARSWPVLPRVLSNLESPVPKRELQDKRLSSPNFTTVHGRSKSFRQSRR